MKKTKSEKSTLVKNTIMLYILRFSTYLFSFILVPYQTRVLGTVVYGVIGVAAAFMLYFQLFLDFGFILSATEDVSKNKTNKEELSNIYSSVTYIKIVFSLISVGVLFFICTVFEKYNDYALYLWSFAATAFNAFLPDFLYRGMEDMSPITYRSVATKAISVLLTFVFLKKPEDYLWVPILQTVGNVVGLVWTQFDVKKRFGVSLFKPNFSHIMNSLKRSATFFLSRIANTIFTATNTIILDIIDPVGVSVGLYTASYKLVSTGQSAMSPIADSLYPYMIRNKDFRLMKKILFITMPIIGLGCIGIFIFADDICSLFFGKDFRDAGVLLRAMMPLAFVTLPDYLFGFPSLSAIGKTKYANYSIYFATIIHLIILSILLITHNLTALSLALLLSLAGINDTLFRISALIYFKKKKNVLEEKNVKTS
ncbi:oligosaccharide flippase family protein [Ruminococcus flavefaciens]|uniref:oligosaccharide flippase family protein n=1 Tax=Ruminococcus flavefaciens TaxID=1265 RepID=UPI0026EA809D|nr:oligosaccharide flippase family protein [Ruminococcus flavefaciens]